MADTFIMAWQLPSGGDPCHGARCRSWRNGASSSGLRSRGGRTVGSFSAGSGSVRRPATGGCAASTSWRTARAGPPAAPLAVLPSWKPPCLRSATRPSGVGRGKLRRSLERASISPPALSTVQAILSRPGRINGGPASAARPYCRFEKEAPNLLWQMDFKGWVALCGGARRHSLTILDDHSRFAPCLKACADQQTETVQAHLQTAFRRYGLPEAMFVDNGSPWGSASGGQWTRLAVWLLKLGVVLLHSTPYHPQSRGKNERFHRTQQAEVFALRQFARLSRVQRAFDAWREVYNFERPHEALGQEVPASRYRPSARLMPERLPKVEYEAHEIVRTVPETKDCISFRGRPWKVPQAFRGERVAIRPLSSEGCFGVFFASHQIAAIDLRLTLR